MRLGAAGACAALAAFAAPSLLAQVSASRDPSIAPAFQEFAAQLEKSVNRGDTAAVRRAIDLDAIAAAAVAGLSAPAPELARFRAGLNASLDLGQQLTGATKVGGTYRLLRVRAGVAGRPQALFRLVTQGGAVTYHELALARGNGGGSVAATDFFLFPHGEWVSETLRRNWIMGAGGQALTAQGKRLTGSAGDILRSVSQLETVSRLQTEGKFGPALEAWRGLPASLQDSKPLLIQRVNIARMLGEAESTEAVRAFSQRFPDDPALDLIKVEACVNKKDYGPALASLDRIKQVVGGDAYLDYLRGSVLYALHDFPAARAALRQAIRAEPTLLEPYWALVTLALEEKDHTEMVRLLTLLERDRGVRIGDLETKGPTYADFVRSDAYRVWMRSRKK